MNTPKMTGTTPMGSFGFSPALLGQSPAALFAKHRSPAPSGSFSSPGMLAALGVDLRSGNLNIGGSMGTPQMPRLPPDENKKRELAEILKLLGSRPGRISEAAVERLAKGMGYGCFLATPFWFFFFFRSAEKLRGGWIAIRRLWPRSPLCHWRRRFSYWM
jgi:hypothetical protein